MLVGPLMVGILLTIVVGMFISTSAILFFTFAVGTALASAILVAAILYYPSNSALATTLPQVERERQFTRGHFDELRRQPKSSCN